MEILDIESAAMPLIRTFIVMWLYIFIRGAINSSNSSGCNYKGHQSLLRFLLAWYVIFGPITFKDLSEFAKDWYPGSKKFFSDFDGSQICIHWILENE